jgi:hypothetical protein
MVAAMLRATGSIMRGTLLVLSFAATCFGAQASSIITLGGTPEATPSIVSLGEPAVAASDDKVAAIPAPQVPESSEPVLAPMVMRGGITGGASADPIPVRSEPAEASVKPGVQADNRSAPSVGQSSQAEIPEPVSNGPRRKPI